jgi:hypothetical protein
VKKSYLAENIFDMYKNWQFSGDARSPFVKKNPGLNMSLAFRFVMVCAMIPYIENRVTEKYHLLFNFLSYYISLFILLMLSKKKK